MTHYAIVIKSTNSGFIAKTPGHRCKESRDYSLNHENQAKQVAQKLLDKVNLNLKTPLTITGFGIISDCGTYVATVGY